MLRPIVAFALLSLANPAFAAERVFDFSEHKLNEPPRGFRSTVSGSGQPGEWKIIMGEVPAVLPPLTPKGPAGDQRAVLAQLSRDRTDEHFPLLVFEDEIFGDFTFTTRFKIVDGQEEQMAGVAFRIQDEKNYYYIRASALGSSFYFFKIVDGIRSAPIGSKVEIPRGAWHELTVECKGNQIRGLLNGKELIPALGDKSFASGKVGFWTKSDSVSHFIDARITYKPRESLAQVLVRETLHEFPRLKGLRILAPGADQSQGQILASDNPADLGQPAGLEEQDVINRSVIYHAKGKDTVTVVMPLHDSNGDTVGAVKVIMKPFPGQTEKNALARALPIVKRIESRVRSLNDLRQ